MIDNKNDIPYKRINIFAGHYGSGKTEIAVNFAMMLAEKGLKTAIVDLDIVNPYFRTADAAQILKDKGIKVIYPMYANTNIDVPAIPQEIYAMFENKEYHVVLDIGGDDLGSKAISRFRDEIARDDSEFFFVINTKRPFTNSIPKIDVMFDEITSVARINPTWLVNNTNLLYETDIDLLENGQKMLLEFSKQRGIPLAFTAVLKNVYEKIDPGLLNKIATPVLVLDKTVVLPWD